MRYTRWEYMIANTKFDMPKHNLETWFNNEGDEGWELVGMIGPTSSEFIRYAFKRPKEIVKR